MQIKNTLIKTSVLVLTAAGALVALSGLAAAAHAWRASAPSKSALPEVVNALPASPVPQRTRRIADIESELITITPHGFEPSEITRGQGRFLLSIDNRSGLETVGLRFSREDGSRLRELSIPREEPDWSEVVELRPGRYVLTEDRNPEWTCVLIITR